MAISPVDFPLINIKKLYVETNAFNGGEGLFKC
jgi:hypothetical protein